MTWIFNAGVIMEQEKKEELFLKLFGAWGKETQIRMCIEEMSELTKELCKYLRYKSFEPEKLEKVKENIIEETADVLLCAQQIQLMFGKNEVEKEMDYKLNRVEKRVNEYIDKHNNN